MKLAVCPGSGFQMHAQRTGIVASILIHAGILFLLFKLPTAIILHPFQTLQIALEPSTEAGSQPLNKIESTTGVQPDRKLRATESKPAREPIAAPERMSQERTVLEPHPAGIAASFSPDKGIPAVQIRRSVEHAVALASERVEMDGGNGRNAGKSGNPDIVETHFGLSGAPSFLRREVPVYPMLARRLGKEGKIVLRLLIDATGKLQNVEVVEKAGYGFTEAAVEAVKKSTYLPALRDGEKTASRALLPIRFQLQ